MISKIKVPESNIARQAEEFARSVSNDMLFNHVMRCYFFGELIALSEGAKPWPEGTPGASWRNEAINGIARDGRDEWKKHSGYHRRSLIENTMYRFKTLTGNCLSARCIGSQATEVAIRVGIINHMVTLARPQSARIS